MPKCTQGCYAKHGYPIRLALSDGSLLTYAASGATRMLYSVEGHPDCVAKTMPGNLSPLWKPSWLQNHNEKNALQRLSSVPFIP